MRSRAKEYPDAAAPEQAAQEQVPDVQEVAPPPKKLKESRCCLPPLTSWDDIWAMIANAATGHAGGGDDMSKEMCAQDLERGAQPWRRHSQKRPGKGEFPCLCSP